MTLYDCKALEHESVMCHEFVMIESLKFKVQRERGSYMTLYNCKALEHVMKVSCVMNLS